MNRSVPMQFAPSPVATLLDAAAELEWLGQQAGDLETKALADSTKRYYDDDFAQYRRWCARLGRTPLPCDPDDVRLYLTDLWLRTDSDGVPVYRAASIERHLASLAYKHYEAGFGRGLARHERIARTLKSIKNDRQERVRRKRPLLLDDLRILITSFEHSCWPAGVLAARDTLAFLLGFATAMRRDELTSLRAGQVTRHLPDGIWVHLGKSKTDQSGEGVTLAVPYGEAVITCVPCAWVRWTRLLAVCDDRTAMMRLVLRQPRDVSTWDHVCRDELPRVEMGAALLRSAGKGGRIASAGMTGGGLNKALKRRLTAAGYDPDLYGAHSLRAGFVTQARRAGADARSVRKQTRHTSDAMVDVYDREWNPLEGNAVRDLGL